MEKTITIFMIAFMLLLSLTANAQWVQVANGIDGKFVQSLASIDNKYFAGTDLFDGVGGVYISTNTGLTWSLSSMNNKSVQTLAILGSYILAGTSGSGVYLSTNNGINWIQTALDNKDVKALVVVGSNIFAGTASSGVYLSTNSGISWTQTSLNNKTINCLTANSGNIIAGTNENNNVYCSTNNGTNWTRIGFEPSSLIAYSLTSLGNNIYAGTGVAGVFRSSNNGTNWYQTSLNNKDVYSLSVSGSTVFAGTWGSGVYFTTNNGSNWSQTVLNNKIVFALAGDNVCAGIYYGGVFSSTNNGTKWTSLSSNVNVLFSSGNNIYAGTNYDLFFSSDAGLNWIPKYVNLKNVKSVLAYNNNIYCGSKDSGVYYTTNDGVSWARTSLNNKTVNSLIRKNSRIIAGTINSGIYYSANDGTNWVQSSLNDVTVNALYVLDSNIFAGTVVGGVYVSTNNGVNWSQSGLTLTNINSFTSIGSVLYAGTDNQGVYFTTNYGLNWTQTVLNNKTINALTFTNGSIFSGTTGSGVYFSNNYGASWSQLNDGLGNQTTKGISYIGGYLVAGTDSNGIYRRYQLLPDTTTSWLMQIKTQISTVFDNENFAGVADSATEGFDSQFDLPEPPPAPGNYISAYFSHPEWGVITGSDFARDIKKNTNVTDTVKRWFFFVKTNVLNDTVKLSFVKDRIPSSLGKYLTDLSTGQRINLKTISEYKYYNTSATVRQFELIIGDSTAPALTMLYPLGSNIFRSGTTKNINWTTSDGTGIDSILIYKSTDAGTNYSFLKSVGFSQSTTWTIPIEYLNNNYSIKIIARDSLGNTKTAKSLNTFTVVGDSLASTANAGWNLLSLPFIPNDSTSVKIFGDDFGSNPYYVSGFGYSTGYYSASYLQQGKGYWLGSLNPIVWDLRGTAIESDSTVQDLEPGFNLIGNNYVRGISKNTLQFIKSGIQYTFSSAVTNGLISNILYKYNGTGYSTSDTLSLFNGYWLGVLQTGVKMVQKPLPSTVTPLKIAPPTPDNWQLSINANTSTQTDEISMIGMRPEATPEYDAQYDAPRPPRAPGNNYLEVYFEHTGGNWPAFLGNKYAADITSPANGNWEFKVESSQSNIPVTINWDRQYLISLGGGVSLVLTDNANNQTVNMKTDSTYTFTYNGIRTFTISSTLTGINITPEIPSEFAMSQNYPNPFNPVTTIKYQLPKSSHVTIKLYDILGKEVVTLVNHEQQAGYYQTNVDAGKLSSGIYFYKMIAGDFVSIKKLMILK